ncbi:MAG: response regulator [Bacteroidales bacterium]|nr:response regulator [Bacteroidales bacterium]
MSYKVLWVDDEYDTPALQEVADLAFDRGINMETGCKSAEEALTHLQHPHDFDAVVLDIRFYKSQSDTLESLGRMKGLREVTKRLEQLKSGGCYLPTFIYSGQPEIYKTEDYSDNYGDYPLFSKDDEGKYKLFDAIITAVNERVETQIKLKYAPLFDVCVPRYMFDSNLTERLLNYARQVEQNDTMRTEYLNDMRKLIEELFEKCEQAGLLISGIPKLNDKSKFLCENKLQKFIPLYVQDSIRFILRCTQEGSHYGIADTDLRNGVAPFLFRSLFFSLSNILVWWKQFIDSNPDEEEICKVVMEVNQNQQEAKSSNVASEEEKMTTESQLNSDGYLVEKDDEEYYHCGPYLMSQKHGRIIEGKKVIVIEEMNNTSSNNQIYPMFAIKVKVMSK